MNPQQQQQYQNHGLNSDTYSEDSDHAISQQQEQYNLNQPAYNFPAQINQRSFNNQQESIDKEYYYFSPNNHKLQNWHVLKIICMFVQIPTLVLNLLLLTGYRQPMIVVFFVHDLYIFLYYCIDHASRINQLKYISWIIGASSIIFAYSIVYFVSEIITTTSDYKYQVKYFAFAEVSKFLNFLEGVLL